MSQARNYCFTLNNYSEEDEHTVYGLSWNQDVRYICVGREIGESGTRHLQGVICFHGKKSFKQMKEIFQNAHWEEMRGTAPQAANYCKKDDDYFEHGDCPKDQKKTGADAIAERWQKAKEGRFEELAPEQIKIYEYIHAKYKNPPTVLDGELEHEWWYGTPGTGKTRKAFEEYPNAFFKDPKERWWDGYAGQDVVIIDDFDKYQVAQGGDMKRWLDRYPFQAPVKGGYINIRPRKIIVTSNYHPNLIWEDAVTQQAIARRVKEVCFDIASQWAPCFNPPL